MRRPLLILLAGALLGGALTLAACGGGSDGLAERPAPEPGSANVVMVMTDDQTLADLEVMTETRRLIGEQGATFSTALVSFPLCCPSRATYLTGQYAHNHGVRSNNPEFDGGYDRLDAATALPVWLQDAGYVTAQIGRYLNFYGVVDPNEIPPGWDEWVVPPGPSTYLMFGYDLNENGEIVHYGKGGGDYQTDVFGEHAVRFIRQQESSDRPFFLSITPLAPHDENDERVPSRFDGPRPAHRHRRALENLEIPQGPAFNERDVGDKPAFVREQPPLSAKKREEARGSFLRRARSLLAVDELVADVVAELRRQGKLDSTYVMFTSDNGFLLGEHRLAGKITPYEETLRVPLLMRGPGIKAGTVVDELVANIDLAPTIAEIAGASPAVTVDGLSVLKPAQGKRELRRSEILYENLDRARVPKQPLYRGLRTERYSYTEFEQGEVELYDLRVDPYQLENLADARGSRALRERLSARLASLSDCAGEGCWRRGPE